MEGRDLKLYRADIDGARAIAVTSVVLYHAGVPFISGGFTGVDIFFAISGYLIGGHVFSELRSGTFSFLRFYGRRAKRILPAFYAVIVFSIVGSIFLLSPYEAQTFGVAATSSIFSVSNVYFWHSTGYFQTKNDLIPLLMTWSLGVEEQFYAVIPLLMVVLTHIRRSLILPAILAVCALSLAFASVELRNHPDLVFYLLPARAWELGVGVILAVIEATWKRAVVPAGWLQAASGIGIVCMLAPIYLLTRSMPFPGLAAAPSVLGTALVIAAPESWINRRLLSLAPVVFIGKISYSWYLWHWPMLAFMRVAAGGEPPGLAIGLVVVASFGAAVLSYYFVEQPFRKSSSAPGPLLLRYGAVSLFFVVGCSAIWLAHGFPARFPALSQDKHPGSSTCLVDYGADKPNLSSSCYPVSYQRPAVVLWGDSHSAALAPALRQVANAEDYSFIQLGKSSCLPLESIAKLVPEHPLVVGECIRFNNDVLRLIKADSRIRLVVMTGVWSEPFRSGTERRPLVLQAAGISDPNSAASQVILCMTALRTTVRDLSTAGKKVIVFNDVPNFDFDPLLRYRTANIPARRSLAGWLGINSDDKGVASSGFGASVQTSTDLLHRTLDSIPGVQLIDLRSRFCDAQNRCIYRLRNQLFYSDSQHLTPVGAEFALEQFQIPQLKR